MRYTFEHDKNSPLCEIMGRNKSDKGSTDIVNSWHNYTTFYYLIFKHLQNKSIRLFELGLGTNNTDIPSNMGSNGRPGASLYGWAEFFPNAKIFGADIDSSILFNIENIRTFFCDQTSSSSIQTLWSHGDLNENFDIIIDDGLHEFDANVCFFENSIYKLNVNGIFIIEDIHVNSIHSYIDKITEWENKYNGLLFTLVKIPSSKNHLDNNLLVVHRIF